MIELLPFTFPSFMREKFEEGSLVFDHRGHWKNGEYLQERHTIDRIFDVLLDNLTHTQEQVFNTWLRNDELDTLEVFIPYKKESYSLECYHCGEKVGLETNGEILRTTSECQYPQGVPPFTLHLNVPSGKIVFANVLHDWYDVQGEDPGDIDINAEIGLKLYSRAYEPTGMITCFCGNTCPSIYRLDDGSLTVGQDGIKWEEPDEDGYAFDGEEIPYPGERVGGVITDLWWWCAADHADLINRLSLEERNNKHVLRHFDIVDVEPGEYEITQYYHTLDLEACTEDRVNGPHTYATIRKI